MTIFFAYSNLKSKPIINKSKYLISTLYDQNEEAVSIGNQTYNLGIYPASFSHTLNDSSYWRIININNNEYNFVNAATGKYIYYDSNLADRASLRFCDGVKEDKSTSFNLEHKRVNNIDYYIIKSQLNPTKAWDRRTQIQDNLYPVGVYNISGADIQCFVFHDTNGNSVIDDGKAPAILPESTQTIGNYSYYLNDFTINGKSPATDVRSNNIYFNITEDNIDTFQDVLISYSMLNTNHKLYINKYPVNQSTTFRLKPNSQNIIEVRYGNQILLSGKLIATSLPIVQLYADNEITNVYELGRAVVTEPYKTNKAEILLSNIRLRGDYAARVEKKSYNIKLKEDDGISPTYRSFMGLRSDNAWILDAMYIDPARMRNRVSTDLWLDFSNPVYYAHLEPSMLNGTRGFYVEVFVNNSYNGLYCMTEKIDRKQLNLKKLKYSSDSSEVTQRGALYKASSWSIGTQLGNPETWGTSVLPSFDNKSESWTAFEVKYPDFGDGEPIEWKPAFDAVKVPYWETNYSDFKNSVNKYFDIPVFIDYYLFLDLILASDNHGKNYYLSVYDQTVSPMVSITPWDLDGVWGRRWDGTTNRTYANQSFEKYIIQNEPKQNNLYLRMMANNTDGFNDKLKSRYRELRKTHFNHEKLMNRFNIYLKHIQNSGADQRESERWQIDGLESEILFLSDWISERLNYLDIHYLGKAYTNTNYISENQFSISPNPAKTFLYVYGVKANESIEIINTQGNILIKTIAINNKTLIDLSSIKPGIYIIRTTHYSTKLIKL
ncbi:MAG: CotH kinase family protein [Paludibacteraceae bacterium]|nr:CotH kinase family protein [Paludibacteraceae bacterium]